MFICLASLCDAERSFFAHIYTDYRAVMWCCAYDITKDKGQADDAVHTAFTQLMDKTALLSSLSDKQLKAYAMVTVKHTAIKCNQKAKKLVCVERTEFPDYDTPERAVIRLWEYEEIRAAVERLGQTDREIIFLRYEIGLDYATISKRLGLSNGAARTRASRAVKNLKKQLEGKGVLDAQP